MDWVVVAGVASAVAGVGGVVVAIIALRISKGAAADARSVPLKLAQREVRGQVREHAQTLIDNLDSARVAVEHGANVGQIPESFVVALGSLELLAPRLPADENAVQLCTIRVRGVELQWNSAASDESSLERAERRVASALQHARAMAQYGDEAAASAEDDVSSAKAEMTARERTRADRRVTLRAAIEKADMGLKSLVKRMNAADNAG